MVWKHLYEIIYEGVQENIVILNVTVFRLRNVVTSNFVIQLLHRLRVKGLHFFSSPSRSKENTEDFEKYVMKVSHKISEFRAPFSRKQRKSRTCAVSKYVYNPYIYILTKN